MPTPLRRLWPWLIWLVGFYVVWIGLVCAGQYWASLQEHWGIAVGMLAGSYVAGSTPMGGGTVGFPVLVLLFDLSPNLGRDFSFAVQSVGMTSATLFILCRRQPLEWAILKWAMVGSLVGLPLGIVFLAPHVPGIAIKLVFGVVWASFGVLHLRRTREICLNQGETPEAHRFDRNAGLLVGLIAGGTVAAVTGVGIDMALYMVMVLLMRADLKTAIPTSVVIMAFNSILGVGTKVLLGDVQPGVYENWLAAAPVVILGAPLGAFIVTRIGRKPTLYVVALLCVFQFVWMIRSEAETLGAVGTALCVVAVLLGNATFEWLWRLGGRIERRASRRLSSEDVGP